VAPPVEGATVHRAVVLGLPVVGDDGADRMVLDVARHTSGEPVPVFREVRRVASR
jgi:hypothetical protein